MRILLRHSSWLMALVGVALVSCAPAPESTVLCEGHPPGEVVITEFMPDPSGTDTGREYVELFNTAASPVSLRGMVLYASRADGTGQKKHILSSGDIPPQGYFVAGDARTDRLPEHLAYSFGADLGSLANVDGLIGLRCGSTVLDEVKYSGPFRSGRSRIFDGALTPDFIADDAEARWCESPSEFEANTYGSPGKKNPSCAEPVGCLDPLTGLNRAPVVPRPGELVIAEYMANPKAVSDSLGEWIELFATAKLDLNDVELGNGMQLMRLGGVRCISMASGSYAVLARTDDSAVNGGLTEVVATFDFALANGAGRILVRTADAGIDQVTYDTTVSGVSNQRDVRKLAAASNDEPASFCPATQPYGEGWDRGTPGAPNLACEPSPEASTCVDRVTMAPRAIARPGPGDLVITELMANPKGVDDSLGEWFEVHVAVAVDLNGLELANEGTGSTTLVSQACLRADAGEWIVFARSSDPAENGGLPNEPFATFGFSLANSGSRSVVLRQGGILIDQVNYSSAVSGVSSQLDARKVDARSNDVPANFCQTSSASNYGAHGLPDGGNAMDHGTPGAPNELCE